MGWMASNAIAEDVNNGECYYVVALAIGSAFGKALKEVNPLCLDQGSVS
jgi:hypothetical protein